MEEANLLNLNPEWIDITNTERSPAVTLFAGDNTEIRVLGTEYRIPGKFLRPIRVGNWAMIILCDDLVVHHLSTWLPQTIERFSRRYTDFGRFRGIIINDIGPVRYIPSQPSQHRSIATMTSEELKSELCRLVTELNDSRISLALIIVPSGCPRWAHRYVSYLETKRWPGLVERSGQFPRMRILKLRYKTLIHMPTRVNDYAERNSLINRKWHQYHNKLGGVNVALKHTFETHGAIFMKEGCLIVSISKSELNVGEWQDSREPAFEGLDIAACVGMWDLASRGMSFRTQIRAQMNNMSVVEIDLLVRDIILSYRERKEGKLPANIIVFRSGVDEHEALEIARRELLPIKRELDYESTRLTYLVMMRRRIIMDQPAEHDWKLLKIHDEASLSEQSICDMVNSLRYLSPKTTTRSCPLPIDLAEMALKKGGHISAGWFGDYRDRYNDHDEERILGDLNHFLTEEMGDRRYRNTTYHVDVRA